MCTFCVRIRILRTFVYVFCARCVASAYVYRFLCVLSGFYVRIRIFVRVERILICWKSRLPILRILWFVESIDDPILMVLWFFEILDDPILRFLWFVESLDDPILRVLWTRKLFVMIGLSGGSNLYDSVEFFIRISARDSPSDITSEVSCWYW